MMAGMNGVALGAGMALAEQITERLDTIERHVRELLELSIEKRHYEIPVGGEVTNGKTFEAFFPEPIPQGFYFIARRLVANAPKGSKLQIFRNTNTANNLIEVAANIQEYADGILGPLIVHGPTRLLAVVLGAEATGAFNAVLSGDLVPIRPRTPKAIR